MRLNSLRKNARAVGVLEGHGFQPSKIRGWLQRRSPLDEASGAPELRVSSRSAQLLLDGGHFLAGCAGAFSCGFFAQE
jgi:hypothetical protein